jgi:mannitol/fructose-specific phosphotransferase system IIA component (Ntr-type)
MRLRDYLQDDLIIVGLEAGSRNELLDAVQEHLESLGLVSKDWEVSAALRAREEAHTTILGQGVAIPHATLAALDEVLLMVVVAESPVPFGVGEDDTVDIFFVLLSPRGREGNHIKILARICRLARHPGFLDNLRGAAHRDQVRDVLLRVDSEHV